MKPLCLFIVVAGSAYAQTAASQTSFRSIDSSLTNVQIALQNIQANAGTPVWTLDANLSTGAKVEGGTATDNTTVINNWLSRASATTLATLPIYGGSVTSGVRIPRTNGNVLIQGNGLGSGFFTKSGTDTFGITNTNPYSAPWIPFDPGQFPPFNVTPSITNVGSVELRDFFLNANGGKDDDCTKVVSCTLSTPYTSGNAKGYVTLGPPLCPGTSPCTTLIGTGSFPVSPASGDWVKITNGSSAIDCATRAGVFVVFCFRQGSSWIAGGSGAFGSYPWYTGIDLSNLNFVRVKNVRVLNSPTYAMRLQNVANAVIEDFTCDQTPNPTTHNHDCVHFDGPSANVTVRGGVYTNIDDDVIAFNALEGYGGAITNVTVDGPQFVNSNDGVNIENVATALLTNMQGTLYGAAVRIIGTSVGDISLTNSTITEITGNGTAALIADSATLVNKIRIANVNVVSPVAGNVGDIVCGSSNTINELEIDNLTQSLNGAGPQGGPFVSIGTGCTVNTMVINGLAVDTTSGAFGMNYAISVSGTVTNLIINSINFNNILAFVDSTNNWDHIVKVSGSALASVLYGIPNAKVVNGVLYRSAECMAVAAQAAVSSCLAIKEGGNPGNIDGTAHYFGMQNAPNGSANPAIFVRDSLGDTVVMTAVAGGISRVGTSTNSPVCVETNNTCRMTTPAAGYASYANNAAAVGAGLPVGGIYTITGSDPLALAVVY